MNLDDMQNASDRLIGEHDYRNFCKMDIRNGVTRFVRRIDNIQFVLKNRNDNWVECQIVGSSFLWHQVRCMMAVLFMVGLGNEKPDVIDFLLDLNRCPSRPHYPMVNETPLILFECKYSKLHLNWMGPANVQNSTSEILLAPIREMWSNSVVQSYILEDMLSEQLQVMKPINQKIVKSNSVYPYFLPTQGHKHIALADRKRANTLDEKLNRKNN